MSAYKVCFISNNIASIKTVIGKYHFEGDFYYYTNNKGSLVFAIIKAESESDARVKAHGIIDEVERE